LVFQNSAVLTGALILQGFVRSSLMTVLILTLIELPAVNERHAGTASGLFFSAAEVGGVLGPLGLGLMYDVTGGFHAGLYALAGLAAAMAVGAIGLSRLANAPRPG
jgi:cyanate permease